jgi:hypothetical protein
VAKRDAKGIAINATKNIMAEVIISRNGVDMVVEMMTIIGIKKTLLKSEIKLASLAKK